MPTKREAIKIIPHNREIEKLFSSLEEYSKSKSPFMCELIRLKFTELVYLLLDSPYRQLIASFLLDAARSESPALSAVLDRHLYSPATVNELAMLSGRSLSRRRLLFRTGDSAFPGPSFPGAVLFGVRYSGIWTGTRTARRGGSGRQACSPSSVMVRSTFSMRRASRL